MQLLKEIFKLAIKFVLHIFYIFPIKKNRIFFDSFEGKQISCNPYYICKALQSNNFDLDIIWNIRKTTVLVDDIKSRFVNYRTFSYIFSLMTSKILITNNDFPSYIPYRKKQIKINTWHGGGAYKRVGVEENNHNKFLYRNLKTHAKNIDYFLSSSKKFTDIMSESNLVENNKYLPFGMPRNELFFDKDKCKEINTKVRKKINFLSDDFVILFAPTFRGEAQNSYFNFALDILKLKKICYQKFKKNIKIIFRGHHTFNNKYSFSDFDFNLSSYPNMQELLCMADMLITDYSSSMWDFSFTNKPGFLFVPDLDKYQNERGFYTPIETWPFAFAKTNEELCQQIMEWTPEFQIEKNKNHHELLESFEDGHATERICKVIEKNLESI